MSHCKKPLICSLTYMQPSCINHLACRRRDEPNPHAHTSRWPGIWKKDVQLYRFINLISHFWLLCAVIINEAFRSSEAQSCSSQNHQTSDTKVKKTLCLLPVLIRKIYINHRGTPAVNSCIQCIQFLHSNHDGESPVVEGLKQLKC